MSKAAGRREGHQRASREAAQDYGCHAVISHWQEAAAHGEPPTRLPGPEYVGRYRYPVIAREGVGDAVGLPRLWRCADASPWDATHDNARAAHTRIQGALNTKTCMTPCIPGVSNGLWCRNSIRPCRESGQARYGPAWLGYLACASKLEVPRGECWGCLTGMIVHGRASVWLGQREATRDMPTLLKQCARQPRRRQDQTVCCLSDSHRLLHDIPTVQK